MRVLLVSHNFLPAHSAGTEVYSGQLALGLRALGHEVAVFTADKDVTRADMSIVRRAWEGVPVVEITNNLYHRDFRETWDNPRVDALFERELERLRPDIVHFQHLLYLSSGCVELAAKGRAAVLFTLHDFWLQCARLGQRLHPDGGLCTRIDFERCGTCLSTFKFRQTAIERVTGHALSALRKGVGVNLSEAARKAAKGLRIGGVPQSAAWEAADAGAAAEMTRAASERDSALRERVVPHVRRFLAPSRFLVERFVEWGVDPARIEYLPNGLDLARFSAQLRTRAAGFAAPLRVGFLGTLAPHKGPQFLLEAWADLPASLRAHAALELRGRSPSNPAFARQLAQLATAAGAALPGPLARSEVPRWMASLDLLVVPSVWYENAPMVILEALATRTPLLVSDLGGMAELVESDVSGVRFAAGNVPALTEALARLLAHPEQLTRLYPRGPISVDIAASTRRLEELYRELGTPTRA